MDFTLFRVNMVRHNRHNFIGSGKTVETLDENRRRERGGGRTWNPGYTRRFSLSRLNSGKLSSLKPLSQNWEHCFVRAMGHISHSDTPVQTGMRIIKPGETRDLWRKEWRRRRRRRRMSKLFYIRGRWNRLVMRAPLNPGSKVFRYEMELHNSLSECFINRDYSYLSPQCGRVYACCVPANH